MPFRPLSRGLSHYRRESVRGANAKMGLPWDAYYVLTKAEDRLTNSKVHPNSGASDYNITHLLSDLTIDQNLNMGGNDITNVDDISPNTITGNIGGTSTLGAVNPFGEIHSSIVFANFVSKGFGIMPEFDNTDDIGTTVYKFKDLYFTGNLSDGTNSLTVADAKTAFDHVTADGSSHGFINQAVTTTSNPTFADVTASNIDLADTISSTTGVITKDGVKFIHNFHHPTGNTEIPEGLNVFVGVNAGNFAMGETATNVQEASKNIGIGSSTLYANTTGYRNMAVGNAALRYNTLGAENIAMGEAALYKNINGFYNVAVGRAALYRTESGHNNVAIGTSAGKGTAGNSFSNNVFVGFLTAQNITTGSSNVFLGCLAGRNQTNIDDQLIIDNQDRGSAANEITKALIYGTFDADPANQTLRINAKITLPDDLVFINEGSGIPFAGIYVKDSVATISVDSDNADVLVTQFTTNSLSNNCTADAANNKITITVLGKYYVDCHASISLNSGGTVAVFLNGYLNGNAQPQLHSKRTVSTTDVGSVSFGSYIDVTTVPWDLDIRANIDNPTARTLTVEDIQLNVKQVGGT